MRDQVRLDGYVLRPGGYALKPGMRVKELIGTDNLLPEYYPDTVEITRLMPPDFHPEKTYVNLDRAMLGNDKDNILLAEFDIVHIYSRFEMEEMPVVTISGEVIRPGTFRLNKNERVTDLVKEGGNLKRKGYTKAVEIRRLRFGKELITPYSIYINLEQASKGDLTQNILLEPFDEVIVRKWDNDDTRVVTINGEVHRPGEYRLADGMTVKDLVTAAGELTLKGFAKRVEIRRIRYGTDLVFPYSIYVNLEEAAKGNPKDNILLQHLDEVVVKKWDYDITQVVRISGEVFRPGEYRLVKGMTIADLVMEAGNVKKSAFLNNAEITRLKLTGSSITSYPITVSLENALKGAPEANIPLQDLDEVMIRRIPEWMEETERYVTMRGEVRFPGTYPIFKGEKLSSVLLRAGAYTDKAYLKGAKFTRKSVRELQQIRMDEVIARMEQNLARKQQDLASVAASKEELEATRTALAGMKVTVDKLKTVKAEGRISIHLSALDELKESPYDLELQGGDSLEVPMSTNSVMVFGEVYNPTTVVQIPGKDLGYYLKKAGGATINSDKDEMYVIRADGTVESRQEKNSFLFYDGFTSMDLDAGDTIVVPQVIEKVAWMRELKDIAFILGQVALAGGVLIAAGL
ncbi:MAG: SLBB domain-containing protein [Pedobacter sp.]